MPAGWVRDSKYEQTRARPDRIRCYLFDRPSEASLRVWLERVTWGGSAVARFSYSALRLRAALSRLDNWSLTSLIPACWLPPKRSASTTRAGVRPAKRISSDVEMLFTRLADTANGKWPLTDLAQGLWDELISTCLAEQVAIDRPEFEKWLTDSGWGEEQSRQSPTAFSRIPSG